MNWDQCYSSERKKKPSKWVDLAYSCIISALFWAAVFCAFYPNV